jgi:hypothetical protein
MTKRLLDRQSDLLHHLTGVAAIFDAGADAVTPSLQRFNRRLLAIEARFSFEKRLSKIEAVFPSSFDLIGKRRERLIRDFVARCPPVAVGRLENARQFYEFLSRSWGRGRQPRYLLDVAACELAIATVRGSVAGDGRCDSMVSMPSLRIRRSPQVELLRLRYDVRPFFEHAAVTINPARRDLRLAVVAQSSSRDPAIFELAPAVFDLVQSFDTWVDWAAVGGMKDARELITDLVARGLVEMKS